MSKKKILKFIMAASVVMLAASLFVFKSDKAQATGTVNFEVQMYQLSDGTYGGTVTSDVGGINCSGASGTCSTTLAGGSSITLTATGNDPTTRFDTWFPGISGGCSGGVNTNSTCTITLPNYDTVYAASATWAEKHDFSVNLTSNGMTGAGSVTVNPGAKTCISTCTFKYAYGVSMSIAETTTNSDTTFIGWSGSSGIGGCGTNSSCSFTSSSDGDGFYAGAAWDWKTYNVNIQIKGTGSGHVSTSPGGLNCSSNCIGSFSRGTTINFSATPASGSKFSGWGTNAEGGNLCLLSAGKSYSGSRNTSSTCQDSVGNRPGLRSPVLIAYFDKGSSTSSSSGSSGSTSTSSSSSGSTGQIDTKAITEANQKNAKNASELGLSKVTLGGKDAYDKKSSLVFNPSQTIVLSGKTAPNNVIKLFIFSDPQEASVKADAKGNWKYSIKGLEPGNHHVEAQVTDPAKHTTSKRLTLVNFAIASPDSKAASAGYAKGGTGIIAYIAAVFAVLLVGAGAYVGWYRWKYKTMPRLRLPNLHPPHFKKSKPQDTPPTYTPPTA